MSNLDYTVLKYLFEAEKPLKIGTIKKGLKIPHSTLGSCIERLEERGFVNYEPYYEVELTEKGEEMAKELLRHRHLIEILLYKELGLDKELAHKESQKFNLLLSCQTINKICERYGHPQKCPCGSEILDSKNCFCRQRSEN
jgi:Mn-dependent DtxR family transcriptional regulator